MTLKGPTDPTHFRTKVGRFRERWYIDRLPGDAIASETEEAWPSISAVKPPFANKYYPMRLVAEMADTEWSRLAGLPTEDRYEAIKANDRKQGGIAMDRGTIVHEWAEALIAGKPPTQPMFVNGRAVNPAALEKANEYLGALQAFFTEHRPEPVAVEVVCINRGLNGVGFGGTADLIARINNQNWMVDWKTRGSDHDAYIEEAAQVAGYSLADYMIVADPETGAPIRQPLPELAGGLIVSIRPDGYRCYPVDLGEGAAVFTQMHKWWATQRNLKPIGKPWAPQTADTLPDVPPSPGRAAADSHTRPAPSEGTGPGVASQHTQRIGALRKRFTALVEGSTLTKMDMARLWPKDTPPLTGHGHTDDQLDELDGLAATLELRYGLVKAEGADIEALTARLQALPEDLLAKVTENAKKVTPPIPNLRTGRATAAQLDLLDSWLVNFEADAADRLRRIVDALTTHDEDRADAYVEWATEQRDTPIKTAATPALQRLTELEADRVIALAWLYENHYDANWENLFVDIYGSKSDALKAAKDVARRHDLTIPKSCREAAADRMTAALTIWTKETQ